MRNNNSSRFGKCTRLMFQRCSDDAGDNGSRDGRSSSNSICDSGSSHVGRGGRLLGAQVQTFLLENSRLVSFSASERNFHIFYQVPAQNLFGLVQTLTSIFFLFRKRLFLPLPSLDCELFWTARRGVESELRGRRHSGRRPAELA